MPAVAEPIPKALRVKLAVVAAVALGVVGGSGWALAQSAPNAKDAIAFRHAQLSQMGKAFKAVNDETHAWSPDWQTIRSNAQSLAQLTSELSTWFPNGTGPDSGVKTRAKAEIWTSPSEFQDKARSAHAAALDLKNAATGSDIAVVTSSEHALGERCASCHTDFRERQ